MNQTYLRGDMYYADLGQGIGSEQEGYRPVVIIQNNVGNKHSPTVIIASVTSKTDAKPKLPTHYYINAEDGLELPSIVLLEQLRTVDKRRLGDFRRSYHTVRHTHPDISVCVCLYRNLNKNFRILPSGNHAEKQIFYQDNRALFSAMLHVPAK